MSAANQACFTIVGLNAFHFSEHQHRKAIRQEAMIIQAWSGPDIYSNFLLEHGRRPNPSQAASIGRLLGGRVKDCNGRLQPPATVRKRRNQIARLLTDACQTTT